MKKLGALMLSVFFFLCLSHVRGQRNEKFLPTLFFKKSSIAFDTIYSYYQNTEDIRDTNEVVTFIANLLKQNAQFKILVTGCSDSKENERCKKLSLKRANKVKALLLANGISENRIIVKAVGKSMPYATPNDIKTAKNKTEEERFRSLNRRVTFSIDKG